MYPAANSAAVAEAEKSPVLLMSAVLLTTVAKLLFGSNALTKATTVYSEPRSLTETFPVNVRSEPASVLSSM